MCSLITLRRAQLSSLRSEEQARPPWGGLPVPVLGDEGQGNPKGKRFPGGLAPLAVEADKLGLQFGIWIDPEMVHLKRELLKEHHDRVIRRSKRKLKWQRNQFVLDLTQPEVRKSGNNPAQTGTIGRLLAV